MDPGPAIPEASLIQGGPGEGPPGGCHHFGDSALQACPSLQVELLTGDNCGPRALMSTLPLLDALSGGQRCLKSPEAEADTGRLWPYGWQTSTACPSSVLGGAHPTGLVSPHSWDSQGQ